MAEDRTHLHRPCVIYNDAPTCWKGQCIVFYVADDLKLRSILEQAGLSSHWGCPFCNMPLSARDCLHNHSECQCDSFKDFTTNNLYEWGEIMGHVTIVTQQLQQKMQLRTLKKKKEMRSKNIEHQLNIEIQRLEDELQEALAMVLNEPKESITNIKKAKDLCNAKYYGQRHHPMLCLPMISFHPCALHAFMAITQTFFWTIVEELHNYRLMDNFHNLLQSLRLNHLQDHLWQLENSKAADDDLRLISHDCVTLTQAMSSILKKLQQEQNQDISAICQRGHKLFTLWQRVSRYYTHREVTSEEIGLCQALVKELFQYFVTKFGTAKPSWYLHHMHQHLPVTLWWIYEEFEWGYAVLTTQAMEHKIKDIKRGHKHTLQNKDCWMTVLTHHLQQSFGYRNYEADHRRNLPVCGSCGGSGHMKTNRSCPNYQHQ